MSNSHSLFQKSEKEESEKEEKEVPQWIDAKKQTHVVKLDGQENRLAAFVNVVPTRKFALGYVERHIDHENLVMGKLYVVDWAKGQGIGKYLFLQILKDLESKPELTSLKIELITEEGAPFYKGVLKKYITDEKILEQIKSGETVTIPKTAFNFEMGAAKSPVVGNPNPFS